MKLGAILPYFYVQKKNKQREVSLFESISPETARKEASRLHTQT
jgi:hypothetical protein